MVLRRTIGEQGAQRLTGSRDAMKAEFLPSRALLLFFVHK